MLNIPHFEGGLPEFVGEKKTSASNFHTLVKNQLAKVFDASVPFFIHRRNTRNTEKNFKLNLNIKGILIDTSIYYDWKNEINPTFKEYKYQSSQMSIFRNVTFKANLHSPVLIEHNNGEMFTRSKNLTFSITKKGAFAILKSKTKDSGRETFLPNSRKLNDLIPLINNDSAIVVARFFPDTVQIFKGNQMKNPYRLLRCLKGSKCRAMSPSMGRRSSSNMLDSNHFLFIPPLNDYEKLVWKGNSGVLDLEELVEKVIKENYESALPFISIIKDE